MKNILLRLVCLALLGSARICSATPIHWPIAVGGNGHYYDFVSGNISWTAAKIDAETRYFAGLQGHLATITSQAEKDFIRLNLPHLRGWLGGFQDTSAPDYSEPGGGWRWVTGEQWNYTNWASPEPNQFEPGENFLEIDPAANSPDHVGWGDQSVTEFFNAGYYIEYQPVPEPSTIMLSLTAAITLGIALARKRQK